MSEETKKAEFSAALEELKELASLQGGSISEEQIRELLPSLDEEQINKVLQYLEAVHIGVGAEPEIPEPGEEDGKYLEFYLEELGEIEELTEDARRVLLMNAMNHDKVAIEELSRAYLIRVVDIARLYLGKGALLEDLIGEGNVALTIALSYLGSQESPEEADAMIAKMIMDAMERYLDSCVIRYDADQELLDKANLVLEKAEELSRSYLRKVTVDELAEVCSLTGDEILEVMRITEGAIAYIEG